MEKEKLEAMLDEKPEYFYNVLPYAQVLGVTSIWCDKLEDITIEAPKWYYSNTTSNTYYDHLMIMSMTNSMSSINDSVATLPINNNTTSKSDDSFNSGFSTGGFSGGGSGGGGGSSW